MCAGAKRHGEDRRSVAARGETFLGQTNATVVVREQNPNARKRKVKNLRKRIFEKRFFRFVQTKLVERIAANSTGVGRTRTRTGRRFSPESLANENRNSTVETAERRTTVATRRNESRRNATTDSRASGRTRTAEKRTAENGCHRTRSAEEFLRGKIGESSSRRRTFSFGSTGRTSGERRTRSAAQRIERGKGIFRPTKRRNRSTPHGVEQRRRIFREENRRNRPSDAPTERTEFDVQREFDGIFSAEREGSSEIDRKRATHFLL